VKSKDTVHEREIEFGMLPEGDIINMRKKNNFIKYAHGLSDNLLCNVVLIM